MMYMPMTLFICGTLFPASREADPNSLSSRVFH